MHGNHFVVQKCGLSSSVFKKTIPNNTTPTFQKEGGVTQPLIFYRWHNIY